MQAVKLSLKKANKIPIEADTVTPDNLAGKTKEEIEAIPVWYGNGQCPLGDFFTVEVEGSDSAENTKIVFEGDVSRVKRIGQGMNAGEIEINGNVDMHCGFGMKGGKIVINGDADSWLGCEMKGGEIILNGNATYYVGSGYRGESCGMRGGKITINGNAKDYLGEHMCGGEILVSGNVGLLPAISNNGGTIVIEGNATLSIQGKRPALSASLSSKMLDFRPFIDILLIRVARRRSGAGFHQHFDAQFTETLGDRRHHGHAAFTFLDFFGDAQTYRHRNLPYRRRQPVSGMPCSSTVFYTCFTCWRTDLPGSMFKSSKKRDDTGFPRARKRPNQCDKTLNSVV